MYKYLKPGLYGLLIIGLSAACDKEDDNANNSSSQSQLSLNLQGLEDLGSDFRYEGWIIVDGAPVSAGLFDVDADGQLSQSSFSINTDDLNAASSYVLTIEPSPDPDPAPSAVHILAGDFNNSTASLSTAHAAAIGTNFSSAAGQYILATPTDGGMSSDELSGLWWLDPSAGPGPALNLPALPEGWTYEGWVVIEGQVLSTGRFKTGDEADDAATYSGAMAGPPFPGEDFLQNAPNGLSFPTNLAGATAVISVEPVPDNSPLPFSLKPLVGTVPAAPNDRELYPMNNNAMASAASGSVSR